MLDVVNKELIRRLHQVQGWSERRIAAELGIARMTVRQYIREEESAPPRYRLTRPRPKPVLDPVLPLLRQWLADDEQQPRKQRRTAQRMWMQLRDEYGFAGGEPTVRVAVRQPKDEQRAVFAPRASPPASVRRWTGGRRSSSSAAGLPPSSSSARGYATRACPS